MTNRCFFCYFVGQTTSWQSSAEAKRMCRPAVMEDLRDAPYCNNPQIKMQKQNLKKKSPWIQTNAGYTAPARYTELCSRSFLPLLFHAPTGSAMLAQRPGRTSSKDLSLTTHLCTSFPCGCSPRGTSPFWDGCPGQLHVPYPSARPMPHPPGGSWAQHCRLGTDREPER